MDVIELTRELGKAIQQDDRYIAYMLAKQVNDNDKELNEDVEKSLKPFMFPENIDLVKQSTEALAKLWERGIENENLDRIIRFSKINRADKYKKYICFLRPEKIIEYMLQDPATGKIDGSFGIPYTNVFGSTVQDMIWYPVISQEGHSSEPVSLDVLFNQ